MRVTKICRELTGVEALYASGFELCDGELVFSVRPRWRRPRCGGCGRCAPGYDRRPERDWRHLGVGSTVLWLRYAPWRVACPECGVTVEQVPRAGHDRRFTRGLAVRRSEFRGAGDEGLARVIKRSRYALRKNPWNMSRSEGQKLADIQANNERLFRARLLNDSLAAPLAYRQPKGARDALEEWLDGRVARSSNRSCTLQGRSASTRKAYWPTSKIV